MLEGAEDQKLKAVSRQLQQHVAQLMRGDVECNHKTCFSTG